MNKSDDILHDRNARYERYRAKMYTTRMPIFWWVQKRSYVLFIVRELTSLFVAAYAVVLMVQLNAFNQGEEAYEALMAFFATPLSITLHVIIFIFVFFHSITWFKLAPSAMVLRIGKRCIPGAAIITVNILMWIVLSLAVAWLILSG